MTSRLVSIPIDCTDPELLGQFWSHVLGWRTVRSGGFGVSIGHSGYPIEIDFRIVPDGRKQAKNRVHLDIAATDGDQDAELDRLLALGAKPVVVGQRAVSWYVLADPEGNEFCLCRTMQDDHD